MIDMLICLLIAIVVAALVLGVVRALLALEPLASIKPYGTLLYAIVLLLIGLIVIQYCVVGGARLTHIG
jgi:hypothetical protein